MSKFPHLTANGNESAFPDISNIRTYQYDNQYDYSKFNTVQMNITLCKVPWDMGEAHIGNRTISGIGNVVHFGTKAERDKWFDEIPDSECFRFATKYRELHRDNKINVPIPYDVAARYNYIAVYYEPMASVENPVMYETAGGIDAWFWFVREVEFLSPNTTCLHLLNDAWQTFIYDMDIPYMMLDRGHAPMSETSISDYLANPIGNCKYLLAPEENEPEPARIATKTSEYVFNAGTMYAVIITTANPWGNWGSKNANTWQTPSVQQYQGGVPAYCAFAIAATRFNDFITNIDKQFLQTIQAVCFVNSWLLDFESTFKFGGYTCHGVSTSYRSVNMMEFNVSDFQYPTEYQKIAKLYTYPYAYIKITDTDGNETDLRIEDTDGQIALDFCLSLTYPWLKINGHISSMGKTKRRNLTFSNVTSRNMPISGNWFDLLVSLDVPTFAVTQSAWNVNDYSTHFDRLQQATAADNAQANQNANASNIVSNASVTTAANSAVTAASNTSASAVQANAFTYNIAVCGTANTVVSDTATSTIAANEQQGALAAASGAITGAVSGIASGNPAAAAAGVINGLVGAATTIASTNIANGLTATQAGITQSSNLANMNQSNTKGVSDATAQIACANSICSANNTATSSHAANDSATIIANATRDRATVTSAITNQQNQAGLGEPSTFGDFQNGDYATSRPLALFSNIVTQDDYTIRKCGDDFLRYGYSYGAQWQFDGNWCPMKHFTYWRLTDFWVKGLQIPDMYVDKLRFFLFGGVTVWKKPEDIGHVTLYENI